MAEPEKGEKKRRASASMESTSLVEKPMGWKPSSLLIDRQLGRSGSMVGSGNTVVKPRPALRQLGMMTGAMALAQQRALAREAERASLELAETRDPAQASPAADPTAMPRRAPTISNQVRGWVAETVRGGLREIRAQFLTLGEPIYNAVAFNARANSEKNRNRRLHCRDETRVVLRTEDGRGGDYIHANWVDGMRRREYIATQAPAAWTAADFWALVWQEKVLSIIMLCGLVEGGKVQCNPYWRPEKGKSVVHGYVRVTCRDLGQFPLTSPIYKFVRTVLELTHLKDQGSLTMTHYAWMGWGEKTPPKDGFPLMMFLDRVRTEHRRAWADKGGPLGPILVHCSDGVNRTGALLSLDLAWRRLLVGGSVSVRDVVYFVRTQRAHAVQRLNDYIFIYFFLFDNLVREKHPGPETQQAAADFRDLLRNSIL